MAPGSPATDADRPESAPDVDVFGIGAPKCATTWLAEVLDEHPSVTVARVKEPMFFAPLGGIFEPEENDDYLDDWDWYADQFKSADPGDVLADMSTQYLWNHDTTPKAIREHYPDARFLVMLRDPVDRAYSHFWGGKLNKHVDAPETFREALEMDHFLRKNRYHTHLTAWFDVFPRDRFEVHLLEDLKRDARGLVRSVYDHVGVDPTFEPPSLHEKVQTSTIRHIDPLMKLAERFYRWGLGPVVDAVNAVGLGPLLKRIGTETVDYPPMDPEDEAYLREELDEEIAALEDLLDRDLSDWRADD